MTDNTDDLVDSYSDVEEGFRAYGPPAVRQKDDYVFLKHAKEQAAAMVASAEQCVESAKAELEAARQRAAFVVRTAEDQAKRLRAITGGLVAYSHGSADLHDAFSKKCDPDPTGNGFDHTEDTP